jgi:FkbM family methyltransferase
VSFISYAQNHEDVMLARVFRGIDAGFYIDVGAQDPRIDSVTKAFYDRGWRGINIEPVATWFDKLARDRPRDINLCLAAGAAEGVVDFYEVADSGLSTSSAEFARRHRDQGHAVVAGKVQASTLDAICAEHLVQLVHFLKIDAEGAELEVLQGIALERVRPWLILVEAKEPNSSVSTHARWDPLLLDRGYAFAYNDGLNRFYLAAEHASLHDAFATPPGVFDDFIPRRLVDQIDHAEGLARHGAALETLAQLRAESIERLERIILDKDAALVASHASHANAEARLVEREANLSTLRGTLAEHVTRQAALLAELAGRDARVSSLLAELAGSEAQVSSLLAELAGSEAQVSSLLAELAGSEAQVSASLAELVGRDAQVSSLQGDIAAQDAELQRRKATIADFASRLRHADGAVANLSRQFVDFHASRLAADAGLAAALAGHADTLAELARAQRDFQILVSSRSWRVTSPLRRAMTGTLAARSHLTRIWRRACVRIGLGGGSVAIPASGSPGDAPSAVVDAGEPCAAPPPLPISADAEQILARYPVLAGAPTREGAA